jgi:hypothetical protein
VTVFVPPPHPAATTTETSAEAAAVNLAWLRSTGQRPPSRLQRGPSALGRRSVDLAGPLLRDLPEALKRGNVLAAMAAAKELPPLNLTDALELTILIARKDPRRHPRVAARWLLFYLEDCDGATIDEAAMVAACLAALAGGCGADTSGPG